MTAFTMLTGSRFAALATIRLGRVNVIQGYVEQDAHLIQAKFGKTFRPWFMPVSGRALAIVYAWHAALNAGTSRGPDNPLFPETVLLRDEAGSFAPAGRARHGWSTSAPIRGIFRCAFAAAVLPYCNPDSFCDMLVW